MPSVSELHPELHVTKNLDPFRTLFTEGFLRGRDVIEFGVGTGALTQLILDAGARSVVGYEILPNICTVTDPRLTLHTADFTKAPITLNRHKAIVANPPYSTLRFLAERVFVHTPDVILMVPPRELHLFPDFEEAFRMSGTDFDPPARGVHLVIRRGFR